MVEITLLDGKRLNFESPISGYEVAKKISNSLAKDAYSMFVDDELTDLSRIIETSSKVQFITLKNKDIILPMIRHSLAHVLAEAILELYPNTKLAVGPAVENGFFYDVMPKAPFKEEDLQKIEKRMHEIIDRKEEISRSVVKTKEALERYKQEEEIFKVSILENITDDTVTFYKQGNFNDLCRGPHVPNTGMLPKSFKLHRLSSNYWKGDKNQPSLQRISALAFLSQSDLESYLALQKELEKNDHRKLGKDLDLFHLQEEAAGSVFWHEKGWKLYRNIEAYIRNKLEQHDYKEVKTPQLINRSLWEQSGHWEKYPEHMFIVENAKDENKQPLALKPMNCPAHIQIFKQGMKSYKDLPLKMAEFGCCHRNEPSGSLHGIMRVRAFTQDDAHIFCTQDQIVSETKAFCSLLKEVYKDILGISDVLVKFSDRPDQRAGDDDVWDIAEKALYNASKEAGLDPVLNKGEGAFYGPKLEFTIKDTLGRDWQLGTLQVDFILPKRLGATYIGEDGEKHIPVMLHRAILGSFERFMGIMIEHYKGRFPLWLSPLHIVLATVSNKVDDYAQKVYQKFIEAGISVELDNRAEKISYKIREHVANKVPLIALIGEKEASEDLLTIRLPQDLGQLVCKTDEVIQHILTHIERKELSLDNFGKK